MTDRVVNFTQPIRDKWTALDKSQKIKMFAALGVILLALIITILILTRTVWHVAYRGLTWNDVQTMSTVLQENNIRHRFVDNNSTLEVAENQLLEAQVLVESHNIMAEQIFTFEDALDLTGMGATETQLRESLRLAREGSLETALMLFDGVTWANVTLVIPDNTRWFAPANEHASASVVLRTTRRITPPEGASMARFVQRTVSGLDLENIEIYDSDFNIIFSGAIDISDDREISAIHEQQVRERAQLMHQVRDLFPQNYNVNVAPNLLYSQELSTEHSLEFSSPFEGGEEGIPLRIQNQQAAASGMPAPGLEPGLGANDMAFPTYPGMFPTNFEASQRATETDFGVNQIHRQVQHMPTSFVRDQSSITVSLERPILFDQQAMMHQDPGFSQQDWEILQAANVNAVPVNDEELIAIYTAMVQSATGIENATVQIFERPEFAHYVRAPLAIGQIVMFAILALLLLLLALGLIRRSQPEEEEEIEPELSVEDLLVSTQMEEALEAEVLEAIGFSEGSEAKIKVEEFIDGKPEAAASLLRHWLNETEW